MEVEDRLRQLTIVKRPESKPVTMVGSNNNNNVKSVVSQHKRFPLPIFCARSRDNHSQVFKRHALQPILSTEIGVVIVI